MPGRESSYIVSSPSNISFNVFIFNKEIFDNLYVKERKLETRLHDIQMELERVDSALGRSGLNYEVVIPFFRHK